MYPSDPESILSAACSERGPRWAALPLTLILPAACASLDAGDELDRAHALVDARTGLGVAWADPERTPAWPPDLPIGPDDAARLALLRNPTLRSAVETVVQARAGLVQAHLLPNPVLNAQLGFTIDGISDTIMGMLMQPLAALWQRPARIDGADARLRAAVLSLSHGALELVTQAKLAHARVVFAERALDLTQQDLALATASLELVDARLARGEATILERNRLGLERLAVENRLADARARRDRALRALLEVCGAADAPEDVAVAAESPTAVPSQVDELTETELMDLAQRQRLDLAAAQVLAEGAIDDVRLAELRKLRSFGMGLAVFRNQSRRDAIGPALTVELPLFDDNRAEVARAASMAREANAQVEQLRQAVLLQLRNALVTVRAARANARRLRDAVLPLAEQNRALAERTLAAGAIDRAEPLRIARQALEVRLEANAAEQAVAEAFLELEYAAGGSVRTTTEARP